MLKMKPIIMSLVAVSAISGFTPVLATAGAHAFLIEGTEITSIETVEGANGFSLQKMEIEIASLKIIKECEEDIGTGTISAGGKSEGTIEGKNCHLYTQSDGRREALTSCAIKEPLEAKFTGQLIGAGLGEVRGSKLLEGLMEFEVKGASCALKGKYPIKGSEVCASPEAALEKTIHKSICTPAGGKLFLEKEGTEQAPVRLFGVGIAKLRSGKRWSAT
jgi:hypothetical protein